MHKKRVVQALNKYLSKLDVKPTGRKNKKPEKEVEREVLNWCRLAGWSVDVVESKAVWSRSAKRFLKGQTRAGFADIVGITDDGLFVAIELKAPGRRGTIRQSQYDYLSGIICKNGFAVVVDSAELLQTYSAKFQSLQGEKRKGYLLSILPIPREMEVDSTPIFLE